MQLLDQYFELQKQIYDYFGYEESWDVLPIDDCCGWFWWCDGSTVWFAESASDLELEIGSCRKCEILAQHKVYTGRDYTMIPIDTNADLNRILIIFENSKKTEPKW